MHKLRRTGGAISTRARRGGQSRDSRSQLMIRSGRRRILLPALLLLAALWLAGRRHPHTVYRPDTWHWRYGVVIGAAVIAASAYVLPWPGLDRAPLFYYPYPALVWPELSMPILLATLGLGAPLLTGVP